MKCKICGAPVGKFGSELLHYQPKFGKVKETSGGVFCFDCSKKVIKAVDILAREQKRK